MAKKKQKLDKSDGLNLSLFAPNTNWVAPNEFPDLSSARLIGCDIESRDPKLRSHGPGFIRGDASIAGISLAVSDMAWYFPVNHLGGGNLDQDMVFEYIADVMKLPCDKVFANAPYDLEGLEVNGIKVKGKIYDVQINEALLDEEREEGYDLNTLCRMHLGTSKDETLLREAATAFNVDPKSGLWKLPAKYVGAYGEFDAHSLLGIFAKQKEALAKDDLLQIFDLETRLLPIIHRMRIVGTPVDLEAAETLSLRLKLDEDSLRHKLFKEYGRHINDQSGPELAAICDKLKITYNRTDAGNPSFEGEWLENHEHPFLKAIAEIRQTAKLKNDYVDKIIKAAVKGRLHIQWKQLVSDDGGAKTGRFAAGNPPLQQFPASKKRNGKPNPIGAAIRALLVADNGLDWFKGDYSQQEPRILTHFAALCKLPGADAAAFSYRANPDMDFYQFMVDIAKVNRRTAKTLYLGICYGMGKKKLAEQLGVSIYKAAEMLKDLNNELPFISALAEKCLQLAQNRGYIKTLCGRKRHFNYWEPSDAYSMKQADPRCDTRPQPLAIAKTKWPMKKLVRSMCHKALNALIQGSAADMMKMGIVRGWEEHKRLPYITVHDEVGGGVKDQADADAWKQTMETCVDLCIPIRMDAEVGRSWK